MPTRADDRDRAVAALLKDVTETAGLSHNALSRVVGVSPDTIGRYLNGRTAIPTPHFVAIANAAKADLPDLIARALAAVEALPVPEPRTTKRPRSPEGTPDAATAARDAAFKQAREQHRNRADG